ncbi:MAG: hypothetical protein WAT74_05770 [Flavobacteriales bacterium]
MDYWALSVVIRVDPWLNDSGIARQLVAEDFAAIEAVGFGPFNTPIFAALPM